MIQADSRAFEDWKPDDVDEYVIKDFLAATITPK